MYLVPPQTTSRPAAGGYIFHKNTWQIFLRPYGELTNSPPGLGGNPESNTLISDMTTVICLDDYHCLDRYGRKDKVPLATIYRLLGPAGSLLRSAGLSACDTCKH